MKFQRGFVWLPFLLGALLLLGISGAAYWYVHQNPQNQPLSIYLQPAASSTEQTQTNTQDSSSNLQTYANSQYGFSLQYPKGSTLDTSSKPAFQGTQIVSIGVGEQYISDFVEVDVDQNTAGCAAPYNGPENHPLAAGTTLINGVTFNKYEIDDPAAGQLGLGYIYKAVRNNLCFIIRAQYVGAEPSHYQEAKATQIEAQNEAGVAQVDTIAHSFTFTTPSASVSVSGMSKYTDSGFGFSFWYPSGWTLTKSAPQSATDNGWYQDGTIVSTIKVQGNTPSTGITIEEFRSTGLSITELGQTMSASPVGVDQKYFFDPSAHAWMYENLTETGQRAPNTITPADVSHNGMGGLHIFPGAERFAANVIVPLSAQNFLVIYTNDPGGNIDENLLAATVIATDPSVGTPVSAVQQTATIQAEKAAYVGN